jgi:hypothetical protein
MFASPLRRLGILERSEITDSFADLESVVAVARRKRPLVSFRRAHSPVAPGYPASAPSGVAAQAALSVIPLHLRGTRSMLRGDHWFPRWSPISVTLTDPIQSSGTDLTARARLRDAVRAVILAGCGEPDLGELIKPAQPVTTTI